MAKRKQGWEKGLGKYSTPVKLTEGKPLEDAQPGREESQAVYETDYPIRGVRKGFS